MTQLHYFISTINLNLKVNSFSFKFVKTKFILRLVKLLIKNNYFIGYTYDKNDLTKILIFFKLNFEQTRPFMLSCEQISKLNRPVYVKYNQYVHSQSPLLVLSTSRGVMTNREAWIQCLGGIVLFKIK